ncbi:cellulase family glycosylhydrolase [Ectobacillus funiculus]
MKENDVFNMLFPNGWGVSIYNRANHIDIEVLADAGFKLARTDMSWDRIETQKGKYDFVSTGYDELNKSLLDKGIRPFYMLGYSNALYEKKQSIVTEEGRKAFAKFVSVVTKRYSQQGVIWEIWNEPNIRYWDPQPSYEDYSRLVKEIALVIRKHDSSGTVVAPAVSGLHEESVKWLEEFLKGTD